MNDIKGISDRPLIQWQGQLVITTAQLTEGIPQKDKEIFTQTIKELEAVLAEMKRKEIYDIYRERIPQITEVDKAEEIAKNIYDEVREYNRELADRVDAAMGILANAYEAQGFNGGLMAARGAL